LKAGKKSLPMGIITELLFYTSVLRDAVSGRFSFAVNKVTSSRLTAMLARVKTIHGVMLGHELHPLLDDPAIFAMLGDAAAAHWGSVGVPTVAFRAGQLSEH